MEQKTLEKTQTEAADHEMVIQAPRPPVVAEEPAQEERSPVPETKTVADRLLGFVGDIRAATWDKLRKDKQPTPQAQPRPQYPQRSTPLVRPDAIYGSVRWAEKELGQARDTLEKMKIVDRMAIGSETELARGLHLFNHNSDPYEAGLLQSLLVVNIKGWTIPLNSAVKILRIPQAADVQRLLIDALEKGKPSDEVLFGIMAALKDKKTLSTVMTYFGLAFVACAPAPEASAYLTLDKLHRTFESGFKTGSHLGLALALKPDPKSQKNTAEQASEIVERIQDPEAIRVAFRSLGIAVADAK